MASGLNKVMVIGNLGRDPELRFTAAGQAVSNFSIAVNRRWKTSDGEQREGTEWFNIVAWGNLAEICGQYLRKGSKVYIEGRLQSRKWEDDQGQERWRTEVVARDMLMLDGRREEQEDDSDEIPF
jgi:single-strand DNA-binding protein